MDDMICVLVDNDWWFLRIFSGKSDLFWGIPILFPFSTLNISNQFEK